MPIKYPTEFKVKAIRRYEKGESIKELCKELNISQSTLYHWRKQYCSIQTDTRTYTPAEFDAISRRLRKVEHVHSIVPAEFLKPPDSKASLMLRSVWPDKYIS